MRGGIEAAPSLCACPLPRLRAAGAISPAGLSRCPRRCLRLPLTGVKGARAPA